MYTNSQTNRLKNKNGIPSDSNQSKSNHENDSKVENKDEDPMEQNPAQVQGQFEDEPSDEEDTTSDEEDATSDEEDYIPDDHGQSPTTSTERPSRFAPGRSAWSEPPFTPDTNKKARLPAAIQQHQSTMGNSVWFELRLLRNVTQVRIQCNESTVGTIKVGGMKSSPNVSKIRHKMELEKAMKAMQYVPENLPLVKDNRAKSGYKGVHKFAESVKVVAKARYCSQNMSLDHRETEQANKTLHHDGKSAASMVLADRELLVDTNQCRTTVRDMAAADIRDNLDRLASEKRKSDSPGFLCNPDGCSDAQTVARLSHLDALRGSRYGQDETAASPAALMLKPPPEAIPLLANNQKRLSNVFSDVERITSKKMKTAHHEGTSVDCPIVIDDAEDLSVGSSENQDNGLGTDTASPGANGERGNEKSPEAGPFGATESGLGFGVRDTVTENQGREGREARVNSQSMVQEKFLEDYSNEEVVALVKAKGEGFKKSCKTIGPL